MLKWKMTNKKMCSYKKLCSVLISLPKAYKDVICQPNVTPLGTEMQGVQVQRMCNV